MVERGPRADLKCPECEAMLILRVEGKFGPFYGCSKWPKCAGAHSAHKDGTPVGIPANQATRAKRREAHNSFDSLRIELVWSRQYSYKWLAEKMGLSAEQCHIGRFNIAQCEQVINVCEKARPQAASHLDS